MTSTSPGIENNLTRASVEQLEEEFGRLHELGLHDLALQLEAIIARKKISAFKASGQSSISESEIYDSFKSFKNEG